MDNQPSFSEVPLFLPKVAWLLPSICSLAVQNVPGLHCAEPLDKAEMSSVAQGQEVG